MPHPAQVQRPRFRWIRSRALGHRGSNESALYVPSCQWYSISWCVSSYAFLRFIEDLFEMHSFEETERIQGKL